MRVALHVVSSWAARTVWDVPAVALTRLTLLVVVVVKALMLPRKDRLALRNTLDIARGRGARAMWNSPAWNLTLLVVDVDASVRRPDDRIGADRVALADEVGSVAWKAEAHLLRERVVEAGATLGDLSVPASSAGFVVASGHLAAGVLGHVLGEALALSVASVEDLVDRQSKPRKWKAGCHTSRLPCLQRQAAVSSSLRPVQIGS